MGAYYEVQWLAGDPYLVWQDESSNWKEKSKKLTLEQLQKHEALYFKHRDEMNKLCETFKP